MHKLLAHVLTSDPAPRAVDSLAELWQAHARRAAEWSSPFDAAVASALVADRLGFAFVGGYQAAVRSLLPGVPASVLVGLSATEQGGAHPRAIQTTLRERGQGWVLTGRKRWATLATLAHELLVVANVGEDESGRPRLRVVRVPTSLPTVRIQPMPPTPFAPEIPHAEVELCDVAVEDEQLLEGDGYDDYLKPFRTIEDIHVYGALLGYLLGVARRFAWRQSGIESLLEPLVAARALSEQPAAAVGVQLALASLLTHSQELVRGLEPEWQRVDPAERERWQRDQGLVQVAAGARAARQKAAWRRVLEEAGASAPR